MAGTKSTTCFGKTSGSKPLTEYASAAEARDAAEYASKTYGKDLTAYRCKTCRKWHLSPADRQTPSTPCTECGKDLYKTQKAAKLRGEILLKEMKVKLRVYKCPQGKGWHLTKNMDSY
ncbi:MAG: hypothetical protein ACR2PW_07520 [Gammaproteobacteria bacterium]